MSPTEIIPLLVLVLVLLGASGAAPRTMDVVFDGEYERTATADVLAIGGGSVTVPANETVTGQLFVIGGNLTVAGQVDGAVRIFAGSVTVAAGGTVTGELQEVSGAVTVAPGGSVGRRTSLPVTPAPASPAERVGLLAMQVLVGGIAGAVLGRRIPGALDNVGGAITEHTLVSGVVGALSALTLLTLFVYMALTLLLLPVSILGLLGEFLVALYSFVCFGYLVGRRLPIERSGLATGVGVAVVLVALELVGFVPVLDIVVTLALVSVGFGAVLLTYFGLRSFQPAEIPG